ncbi:hypothetical protein HOLleu_02093 [Holothuria leucospilota]|uniref:Uncharacterized protein n=1 Tax=Holothuria leucospilota TaxID=206669 RepID=A0A9Q1CPU9_HOLLE|nr:hypothetical protein HOLleu_02093 [Holothuria leucospilota]
MLFGSAVPRTRSLGSSVYVGLLQMPSAVSMMAFNSGRGYWSCCTSKIDARQMITCMQQTENDCLMLRLNHHRKEWLCGRRGTT